MIGSFSASAVRLGDLLSGAVAYSIPGFQRPYSWTTAEVARLIDDILFAVNGQNLVEAQGRVFFLGTLVLIDKRSADGDGQPGIATCDVVDGQQRLVTMTILFAVLRDLARADGDLALAERMDRHIRLSSEHEGGAGRYGLVLRERDAHVLTDYVQQMDGCLADADPSEFEGAQREIIANRNYMYEELKSLESDERHRLAVFLEEVCELVAIRTDDVDNAFRIFMVVNQPGKALTRNDLLKAELIGALPATWDRAPYIRRWEEAESACGAQFEQFFSHFRAAFGNARAPIIQEMRRLARESGDIQGFLDGKLMPAAAVFAALQGRLRGPPILNARAVRSVRNLERLSHADWVPPALLWIYERGDAPNDIAAFLVALDRYAYGQLLLGVGRDKRVTRYVGIVEQIRAGGAGLEPDRLLALTAEEVRNIAFNAGNDLYNRSSIACKLLLMRLNDAAGDVLTPHDPGDVTIEHVLPQRVGRNSSWRVLFSEAELRRCSGSLGNLALVTARTNKVVRNFEFETKLAHYRQDPHMLSMRINGGILTHAQFGPQEIAAREAALMDLIRDVWGAPARRTP